MQAFCNISWIYVHYAIYNYKFPVFIAETFAESIKQSSTLKLNFLRQIFKPINFHTRILKDFWEDLNIPEGQT